MLCVLARVFAIAAGLLLASAAKAGDQAGKITVGHLLERASDAAQQINDAPTRAESLVGIAQLQAQIVDAGAARATLKLMFQAIELVKDPSKRCAASKRAVYATLSAADPSLAAEAMAEFWRLLTEASAAGRAWLGVQVVDFFTPDATRQARPDQLYGALVKHVDAESPAAGAGIEDGDVIVAINGGKITGGRDLPQKIALVRAGTRIEVELVRDGEKKLLRVELGAHPDSRRAQNACRGDGIELLCQVATLQAGMGDGPASVASLREAEAELQKLPKDLRSFFMRAPLIALTHVQIGSVQSGIDVAATIEDPVGRVHTLASIVDILTARGEKDKARQIFGQALAAAHGAPNPRQRSLAIKIVAEAQVRFGDPVSARNTIAATSDAARAGEIAIAIAKASAKTDRAVALTALREALQQATKIVDEEGRLEALARIAGEQREIGPLPELLSLAAQIDKPRDRLRLVERIVEANIGTGDLTAALAAAALAPEGTDKATLLRKIAIAQASNGDLRAALSTIGGGSDPLAEVSIYTAAAMHHANAGRLSAARSDVARAVAIATRNDHTGDTAWDRVQAWTKIVEAKAAAGDVRGARQAAARIDNAFFRMVALNDEVLGAQAKMMANKSELRATVREIVAATLQIEKDPSHAVIPLTSAAQLLLQVGEAAKVPAIMEAIPDGPAPFRMESLIRLVAAQAKTGNTADAMATLDKMRAAIARDDGPSWRASRLRTLATTQAEIGDVRGVVTWSDGLPTPEEQASALHGAAEGRLSSGQKWRLEGLGQVRLDGDLRSFRFHKVKRPATGAEVMREFDESLDRKLEALNQTIKREPRNAAAYLQRAVLYEAKGHLNLAAADHSKVIEIHRRSTEGYVKRARHYLRTKQYDRAIADCIRAVKIDPEDDEVHRLLGGVYYARGNADRAIASFSRALTINPRLVEAYVERAAAHAKRRNYPSAIADHDTAIRLNPVNSDYYNGRAWVYLQAGSAAQGRADVDRALQLDPDNAYAFDTRAHILERQGEREAAERDYRKALSLKPDLSESMAGLKRLGATR